MLKCLSQNKAKFLKFHMFKQQNFEPIIIIINDMVGDSLFCQGTHLKHSRICLPNYIGNMNSSDNGRKPSEISNSESKIAHI